MPGQHPDIAMNCGEIRAVAGEVSSMASGVGAMKAYAEETILTADLFGSIPGDSPAAARFVTKAVELAESLGAATDFLNEYATRLNGAANLIEQQDTDSANHIASVGGE